MKNVIDINLCDRLPDAEQTRAHRPRGARDRARRSTDGTGWSRSSGPCVRGR